MEFRLHYQGIIKSGFQSNTVNKHEIRIYLHSQLKILAEEKPFKTLLTKYTDRKNIKGIDYIPLLAKKMEPIVSLDILLLSHHKESHLLKRTGDIDNKLKTIFDALSCPLDEQVKEYLEQAECYCLLEDDNLVTRVSVETDRLLCYNNSKKGNNLNESNNDVLAIIKVYYKIGAPLFDDIGMSN